MPLHGQGGVGMHWDVLSRFACVPEARWFLGQSVCVQRLGTKGFASCTRVLVTWRIVMRMDDVICAGMQ
jgi:hypothetical protein